MKRLVKSATPLIFLLCIAGPAALIAPSTPAGAADEARGPDFSLSTPDGATVSLNQFVGSKAVLLAFWATWCPHCNEAIPELSRLDSGPLSGKLKVLAVDWKESRKKVASFMKYKDIRYTVLLDAEGEVSRMYTVREIPTYILLGKDGKIVYRGNALPPSIEKHL